MKPLALVNEEAISAKHAFTLETRLQQMGFSVVYVRGGNPVTIISGTAPSLEWLSVQLLRSIAANPISEDLDHGVMAQNAVSLASALLHELDQ